MYNSARARACVRVRVCVCVCVCVCSIAVFFLTPKEDLVYVSENESC